MHAETYPGTPPFMPGGGPLERMREPSTWAGLAVLIGAVFPNAAEAAQSVTTAVPYLVAAAASVIAIFKRG